MKKTIAITLLLITHFSWVSSSHACEIVEVKRTLEKHYKEVEISEPLTVRAIENRQMVSIEVDGKKKELPFGRTNSDWERFKKNLSSGDCIVHFKTGDKSWNSLYGREGYILIKNKDIVVVIYTVVS